LRATLLELGGATVNVGHPHHPKLEFTAVEFLVVFVPLKRELGLSLI